MKMGSSMFCFVFSLCKLNMQRWKIASFEILCFYFFQGKSSYCITLKELSTLGKLFAHITIAATNIINFHLFQVHALKPQFVLRKGAPSHLHIPVSITGSSCDTKKCLASSDTDLFCNPQLAVYFASHSLIGILRRLCQQIYYRPQTWVQQSITLLCLRGYGDFGSTFTSAVIWM